MVFADGASPVYTVDLCDVCFGDAQNAAREQLAHVEETERRIAEPEVARRLDDDDAGEHTAVIEGSNEGHAT